MDALHFTVLSQLAQFQRWHSVQFGLRILPSYTKPFLGTQLMGAF